MDPVVHATGRIYKYTTSGQPAKALRVAEYFERKPEYRKDLMFCLNSADAAARTKSVKTLTTRTPLHYRRLARGCANYDPRIEATFWEARASEAFRKKNFPAALRMYRWVLKLDPNDRNRLDLVSKRISEVKEKIKERKAAKLPLVEQRKDTATKPRHSQ